MPSLLDLLFVQLRLQITHPSAKCRPLQFADLALVFTLAVTLPTSSPPSPPCPPMPCGQFFILLSCFIAVAVNFSSFLVIGKTSPVTYQVGNNTDPPSALIHMPIIGWRRSAESGFEALASQKPELRPSLEPVLRHVTALDCSCGNGQWSYNPSIWP